MSYVEEILMPQVIAELARLHGDPEVIRRCTEIATGVPTAPIVLPSGPVAADVLTSGTATPEPPAPVEVVPEVAALPVTEAVPDPPAPPLEDAATWQAAVDDAEAKLKAAQDAPHG